MHFQFTTICRGTSPLFTLLKSKGVNPWEYISFYSLRTEGRVGAARHSEQVYVHSKVMIVDDLVALIGSANINDRSLGKDTDSEIAVVVSGGASVLSRMDGMQYLASEFVHCLRVRLWREHLGLLRTPGYDVSDAVSDEVFFGLWMTIARSNTAYYQKHFPETARFSKLFDSVTLDAFPIPERPMGHVVWFSYEFLCDKDNGNMLPWYLSKLPFPLSIFH
jgi:phosphatidylserine/phosphatidylglycerophosphate/cardiolipin synthase-like enzyme